MSDHHETQESQKAPSSDGEAHWFSRKIDALRDPSQSMPSHDEIAKRRAEWMAIRDKNLAKRAAESVQKPVEPEQAPVPTQQKTSEVDHCEPTWVERNKWVVIAAIAAVTAIVVAYILRPSRYRVMGEHNRYILDAKTGEAFLPSGKRVVYP